MLYAAGELKRLGADSASSECYNRASKAVGNGYSEAELKGTLYRHINQVIGEIEHLSGGDVAKQMELAERVFKSLKGPSKAAMEDRADRVQNSILNDFLTEHYIKKYAPNVTMLCKDNKEASRLLQVFNKCDILFMS